MTPGRRAAIHRVFTASVFLAALALTYLYFDGRATAILDARTQVSKARDGARGALQKEVQSLVGNLFQWDPVSAPRDDDGRPVPPAGFSSVSRQSGDKKTPPHGLRVPEADRTLTVRGPVYIGNTFSDTTQTLEGSTTLGTADYQTLLQFSGGGHGTLTVEASFEDPDAAQQDVSVDVLFGIAPENPAPLPGGPVVVHRARKDPTDPVKVSFDLDITDDVRTKAHTLVLRTPANVSPVSVKWTATIGRAAQQEVVIAVWTEFKEPQTGLAHIEKPLSVPVRLPERRTMVPVEREDGTFDEVEVVLPPEDLSVPFTGSLPDAVVETTWRGYLVGRVNLDALAASVRDALNGPEFDNEQWGDRLYLTDASGNVVMAIPALHDRAKQRAKREGMNSLASLATQRVKLRNPGTETYSGFSGFTVIGSYGPVEHINGGLIVEREEKEVLEPWRGLQAWHVFAILFGLCLVYPLVPPLVRRVRRETDLPRLMQFARPYVPHIGAILAAMVLFTSGNAMYVYYTKIITDEVLLSGGSDAYGRLAEIAWILAGAGALMASAQWLRLYLAKFLQNSIADDLRCRLCDQLVRLPMAYHSKQRAGDLLSRIQGDVTETRKGLELLFGKVITEPIMLVGLVGVAFYTNWRLAMFVFVGMPILLVPISYFGKRVKKYARKRQAKRADVTQAINQMLTGVRVVKAFRMEEHESKQIRSVSREFFRESMRVARNQVTSRATLEFVQQASSVIILVVGGWLVLERSVTIGDLTAFIVVIVRLYRSAKDLTSTYHKTQESMAGAERIFEVLDTPDAMADIPNARALVRPRREIAFDHVSFRYGPDQPMVLSDIDFVAPVGTTVALVGTTGAGKSTLLDLVARFYDPEEGRVAIDGVDARQFTRTSLMAQIAIVTQEPFLFNASVAENLRYGKPGASQSEIEAAARAAKVHEEILKFDEGYDTVVGERGGRLSGGQRQRVTIARAILKDPPILILDEATSALDSRVEKQVQDALNNLMEGRTTFVIAHRLSTIQDADLILVLEGGRIVERGTHDELVAISGGVYRHLYDIQFGAALDAEEGSPGSAGERRSAAG